MESEIFRKLPLFPLPLVLFPGAVLPLHIFEERYKLMIRTCLETDKQFGIVLQESGEGQPPSPPAEVGCIAEIMMMIPLEDGRMNILTKGKSRFVVRTLFHDQSYLVGEIDELHEDLELSAGTEADAIRVKKLLAELIALAADLSDSPLLEGSIPDEAEALSFASAAALPMENSVKQKLLEMTSTSARLKELKTIMRSLLETYRRRKLAKKAAEGNGHGGNVAL